MLDVHLRSLCCCCSCMRHVHRRMVTQSRMYLLSLYTRTHTKKKKNALVIEVGRRNEEVRYIWYQSGFNPRLGIATDFVDMI
jgi:hypothetical protein